MQISFREHTLDNGLRIVLHQDPHQPIVALNLWYHVGAKNERPGKTGFAHLFEHLMFQGSANVDPNEHFKFVQEAGGSLNASTSFDRTNYYETLPSNQLELGLWLESDRMRSLNVNQRNLDNQKKVVIEERRFRYDNRPYGTMYEKLFKCAYGADPYSWPVIGSIEDVEQASLEEVQAFHAMYYRPGNATLSLAGDIDFDSALRSIEHYFGDISPGSEAPFRPEPPAVSSPAQSRETVFDDVPHPALVIGAKMPALTSEEVYAFETLTYLLTSGKSSRLYNKLVYTSRLAQSVSSFPYALEHPGLFIIHAKAQEGKALEDIEAEIWSVLEETQKEGPTDQELAKAKNRYEAAYLRSMMQVQSRADAMNAFAVYFNDVSRLNQELEAIRQVTADDVQAVCRTYLQQQNATVLYYLPKEQR